MNKERMEQVLQHICCEDEIKTFHQWISELCNPDSRIVQHSSDKFKTITEEQSMQKTSETATDFKDASTTGLMTSTNLESATGDGENLLRSLANKYVSNLYPSYFWVHRFLRTFFDQTDVNDFYFSPEILSISATRIMFIDQGKCRF